MALPVDPYLAAALLLLVAGVVGSVVPLVPGVPLSVVGVLLYWWSTAYGEPGTAFVAVVLLVGAAAVAVDLFAGAISARAGGASRTTMAVAAVASLALFVVAGPLGIVVGVAVTVFGAELYRTRRVEGSARAAGYATLGLLASTAVQLLVAGSILVGFVLAVAL